MLQLLLLCAIALTAVQADGELLLMNIPSYLRFTENEGVAQSLLPEIFLASLGFTTKESNWIGMSIANPLDFSESVVVIVVDGIDSLHIPNRTTYSLRADEDEEATWHNINTGIRNRGSKNTLVRFNLNDGLIALGRSALGELKTTPINSASLTFLNSSREDDRKFLEEIQLLHAIAENVPSVIKADSNPDVYWFVASQMNAVIKYHGKNSPAVGEAVSLLVDAIKVINEAFVKAYQGQTLVAVVTNDASEAPQTRSVTLQRQRRDTTDKANQTKSVESTSEAKRVSNNTEFNSNKIILQQDDQQDEKSIVGDEEETNTNTENTNEPISDTTLTTLNTDIRDDSEENDKSDQDLTNKDHNTNTNLKEIGQGDLNLAKNYSENYPVIFNILLWFGVVFVFSLLAICIAIADMDPGRDSIIYRMTSNRMKKDN